MSTIVHPGDALSRNQRLVYVLVLGALTALGPFTIDLYLPAFLALMLAIVSLWFVVRTVPALVG